MQVFFKLIVESTLSGQEYTGSRRFSFSNAWEFVFLSLTCFDFPFWTFLSLYFIFEPLKSFLDSILLPPQAIHIKEKNHPDSTVSGKQKA